MPKQIDNKILTALKDALVANNGEISPEAEARILGDEDADAYYEALPATWPDIFPAPEPSATQTKPPRGRSASPKASSSAKQIELPMITKAFLHREDGQSVELLVAKVTNSTVHLREKPPVPRDEVTLKIRGVDVTVDVNSLKGKSGNAEVHGVPVARLLEMVEVARP